MDEPHQRVFPIRLTISSSCSLIDQGVDNPPVVSDTPQRSGPSLILGPEYGSGERIELSAEQVEELSRTTSNIQRQSTAESSGDGPRDGSRQVLSERYEYAVLGDGTHGVIQATRDVFTRCEDEPIHIPGAIQSYGMLVALRQEEIGRFIPRIVSENSYNICRRTPQDLFNLDNFLDAVPLFQRPLFTSKLQAVERKFQSTGKSDVPVIFPLSFWDALGEIIPTLCACHRVDPDLFVCEFELQDYSKHPDAAPESELTELSNVQTSKHSTVSTERDSQPTHPPLLDSSDLEFSTSTEDHGFQILNITSSIQQQFASARTVDSLVNKTVNVVKQLTGFHRCMVYQFDQSFNGEVIAEIVDPKCPSVDRFKGLHFPATDIPKQARELYKINKVRLLFDIRKPTARLVGRTRDDIVVPLDLTHSYLRAMSPVHLKYLNNLGVRSSMSMSLQYENELWGLIACHSYGPTATRVPFRIREICFLVGLSASTSLENLLNADKLQAFKIMDVLQFNSNPSECITASSDELLRLFDADCGFLVVDGQAKTIGKLASYTESVTLLKYLYFRQLGQILFSSDIRKDLPDLKYDLGFKALGGFLYIPLSLAAPDFMIFFRRDQVKQVHWAGNPACGDKIGLLKPRTSFKKWTEIVTGTCKSWMPEQLNLAAMAQLVYGSFIRVWREKEAAASDSRLKQILLRDASHQFRTPLNAVINYLEMALEKPLDNGTKQILSISHTASKSLIYVIDDLLNLTSNKPDNALQLTDPFDVHTALEDVISPLRHVTQAKGIGLRIVESQTGSRYVCGDVQRFQRAITNLVSNAIEHTDSGEVVVEWSNPRDEENKCLTRIAVIDSGCGLTERELDDIFQEFEQVPDEDADGISEPIPPQRDDVLHLGVGLAFVARYVKNRTGQIIVTSAKSKGSTFAIEIPFLTADSAAHPFQSFTGVDTPVSGRTPPVLPNLHLPDPTQLSPSIEAQEPYVASPGVATFGPTSPTISITLPSDPSSPGPSCPSDQLATQFKFGSLPFRTSTGDLLVILIADDNNINVHVLEKRLKKLGHQVKVSRDGQECFNIFKEHHDAIDFILMDIDMPIVDGFQSTAFIRSFEKENSGTDCSRVLQSYGRTPVFAISGHLRREEAAKYVDAGFDGWMPKPVDMSRIGLYLAGALDQGTRQRGVYDEKQFELGGWFERR